MQIHTQYIRIFCGERGRRQVVTKFYELSQTTRAVGGVRWSVYVAVPGVKKTRIVSNVRFLLRF